MKKWVGTVVVAIVVVVVVVVVVAVDFALNDSALIRFKQDD